MKDNPQLRFILITIAVLLALMLLVVVIQLAVPSTDGTPTQNTGLAAASGLNLA